MADQSAAQVAQRYSLAIDTPTGERAARGRKLHDLVARNLNGRHVVDTDAFEVTVKHLQRRKRTDDDNGADLLLDLHNDGLQTQDKIGITLAIWEARVHRIFAELCVELRRSELLELVQRDPAIR